MTFDIRTQPGTALFAALIRCSTLALRVHSHLVARRQALSAETDSAANQFGAPESVEDPRGTFPLFVARVCPSRICRIPG